MPYGKLTAIVTKQGNDVSVTSSDAQWKHWVTLCSRATIQTKGEGYYRQKNTESYTKAYIDRGDFTTRMKLTTVKDWSFDGDRLKADVCFETIPKVISDNVFEFTLVPELPDSAEYEIRFDLRAKK